MTKQLSSLSLLLPLSLTYTQTHTPPDCLMASPVGKPRCSTWSSRPSTWTCRPSWERCSATPPTQASSYQPYCSWCKETLWLSGVVAHYRLTVKYLRYLPWHCLDGAGRSRCSPGVRNQRWVSLRRSWSKLFLHDRLAIYYLNSVSKAYQNSNIELKKKMQMVSWQHLLKH